MVEEPNAQAPVDRATAGLAGLEREMRRLRHRCRAREDAVDRLAAAVLMLRQANRALHEENAILKVELERFARRPRLQT